MARNGGMIQFDGKLDNPMNLLKWLTELDNLKIDGRIEEVQRDGIENRLFKKRFFPGWYSSARDDP